MSRPCVQAWPATASIWSACWNSWRVGAVWPPEIIRYNLTDAAEAHRVSESRHLRGKLVFEVR